MNMSKRRAKSRKRLNLISIHILIRTRPKQIFKGILDFKHNKKSYRRVGSLSACHSAENIDKERLSGLKGMKKREYFFSFFTYPIISFLIALIILLIIVTVNFIMYGNLILMFKDIFLTLVIVFSILTVLGMLDGSFCSSGIGLFFAKKLRLINKNMLNNLVYKTEIKGRIARGAETIEMALTVIYLVIYIHG